MSVIIISQMCDYSSSSDFKRKQLFCKIAYILANSFSLE